MSEFRTLPWSDGPDGSPRRLGVAADSRLHRSLDCRDCRVDALHSQAVDRLANGRVGAAGEAP